MSAVNITEYNIAGIHIQIKSPYPTVITESFVPFSIEGNKRTSSCADIRYEVDIQEVHRLPIISGNEIMHNQDYSIWMTDEGTYVRRFHDHTNNNHPYAIMRSFFDINKVQIEYLPEGRQFFNEAGNCFFHIGWETILMNEKKMILHASCVRTTEGAILFSGPSGIGKSTQADLWCKYADANLLNGDRPILGMEGNQWYAYGSPYAGSSRCYINDKCKIRAIAILKEAETCAVRRLNEMEAFRKIYSGLTVNNWDVDLVNKVCDRVMELVKDVPIYELERVPNRTAVEMLRKIIEEEEGWIQKK